MEPVDGGGGVGIAGLDVVGIVGAGRFATTPSRKWRKSSGSQGDQAATEASRRRLDARAATHGIVR